MKTFYQLLMISLLVIIVTTIQGYGENSLCGNNSINGVDAPCPCPPPQPGANFFDPYTGNVHREILDLQVWGSVGEISLDWRRFYNSRGGFMWNYSFHYTMYDGGVNSQGRPQLNIHYPEGGENVFTQDANDPTLWLPLPGVGKRLFQEDNNFFLQMANGHRYRFEKLADSNGDVYYQLQDIKDSQQNLYTLTYNSDKLLTRVTEPAGRFLQVDYTNISGVSVISQVSTSDGRSVKYNNELFDDGVSKWIRFNSADYGDGTQALYTYYQDQPGGFLSVEHAIDPRYVGAAVNMKYTYDYSIAPGYVMEEKNGVTGEVLATLIAEPDVRKVCYPNGRVQTYVTPTSSLGRTQEYIDGLGRKTTYTYDNGGIGFIETIINPSGRRTTYNARTIYGNPLEVTHPDGSKEQWTRDDLDLVLSYTNELGRITTYTRDEKHRITEISYPDGSKEFFTYNNFGQIITHTLRNGAVEEFDYNSTGLLLSHTDALGSETKFTYNSSDLRSSITDALGNTTIYEFNERGLMTKITFADSNTKLYTYDTFGNQTSTTNELGNTWSTLFDEFRRPQNITDPLNRETNYSYDLTGVGCCSYSNNKPNKITLPSGKTTEIEYDVEWQMIRETAGAGTSEAASTFFEYDLEGNLLTVIDPEGNSYRYAYDARHRRTSTTNPKGDVTEYILDPVGNLIRGIRPDNGVTQNKFDDMNRLIETIDPNGEVTKMSYNVAGNLVQFTDAKNQVYNFEYDNMNRRTRMIYPNGSSENYTYNLISNLSTYTTRAGQSVSYSYDSRNRITITDWNDDTPDVVTSYDEAGRILTITSSVSSLSYNYNEANELESETQDVAGGGTAKTVEYSYNPDGIRNTMIYPGGTEITYSYSARNQIASISEGGQILVNYSYDLNGNRVNKVLQNGTSTSYTYDANNQVLTMIHQKAGVSFARFDYGYDNVNRRTFVKRDNDRGDVYNYDAIDQVTKVSYDVTTPEAVLDNPLRTVNYAWDATGNRTIVSDNDISTNYTVNNLNQYTQVGDLVFTYSENGGLETYSGWTYTYDAQNRLIEATNEATTVVFAYDARNRRVKQLENGSTTFFYYDNWNLLEERSSNDVLLERYVHGALMDELLTMVSGSNIVYYLHDALGSVTHLTDPTGNVVEKYTYDIFGGPSIMNGSGASIEASAFNNRFLFTGREYIAGIDLYDYRNRMYSPNLGRFIQPDPIKFSAGDYNFYRYVGNSPMNWRDPSGLISIQGLLNIINQFLDLLFPDNECPNGGNNGNGGNGDNVPVPPVPGPPVPVPPVPGPPVPGPTTLVVQGNPSWADYWSNNMEALRLPTPSTIFEVAATALANAGAITTVSSTFRTVTVLELAGAGTVAESVVVAAGGVAAVYVGASIGSAATATGNWIRDLIWR
ncbi:hypothetical protein BH23BAC1_BH23BAC1_05790 [soil metagenome]